MKRYFLMIFALCGFFNFEGICHELKNKKELSEYLGILLWIELHDSFDFPYEIDSVIEGIRKAEKGARYTRLEIQKELAEIEKDLYDQKVAHNLLEAEIFLKKISKEEGVTEVIKEKLYIKILCCKNDKATLIHTKGLFHLKCDLFKGDPIIDTYQMGKPIAQDLETAIEGFSLGVKGM